MEVLELPLEAVVVGSGRYSIIAIPSIWTCLALLAAAFGFYWRVSAVNSSSSASSFFSHPITVSSLKRQPEKEEEEEEEEEEGPELEQQVVSISTPTLSSRPDLGDYYWFCDGEIEEEGIDENDDDEEEEERDEVAGVVACWEEETGRTFGSVEWYRDLAWSRFLDMTAINGNVVKLWDADDHRIRTKFHGKRWLEQKPPGERRAKWEL